MLFDLIQRVNVSKSDIMTGAETKILSKVKFMWFINNVKACFLVFLFSFSFSYSAYTQSENSLHIEKCARMQSGLIMQFPNGEYNEDVNPGISFQYCYGIKAGTRAGIGFGAGFHFFKEESYIPIVFDLVYFIGQNKKCFFIYGDGGYSLGWSSDFKEYDHSDFKGGLTLGTGFGKKILILEQMALFINAGYQYQHAQLKYEPEPDQTKNKSLHYHMLIVSLGIMIEQ
jgi:hypothetical protein